MALLPGDSFQRGLLPVDGHRPAEPRRRIRRERPRRRQPAPVQRGRQQPQRLVPRGPGELPLDLVTLARQPAGRPPGREQGIPDLDLERIGPVVYLPHRPRGVQREGPLRPVPVEPGKTHPPLRCGPGRCEQRRADPVAGVPVRERDEPDLVVPRFAVPRRRVVALDRAFPLPRAPPDSRPRISGRVKRCLLGSVRSRTARDHRDGWRRFRVSAVPSRGAVGPRSVTESSRNHLGGSGRGADTMHGMLPRQPCPDAGR